MLEGLRELSLTWKLFPTTVQIIFLFPGYIAGCRCLLLLEEAKFQKSEECRIHCRHSSVLEVAPWRVIPVSFCSVPSAKPIGGDDLKRAMHPAFVPLLWPLNPPFIYIKLTSRPEEQGTIRPSSRAVPKYLVLSVASEKKKERKRKVTFQRANRVLGRRRKGRGMYGCWLWNCQICLMNHYLWLSRQESDLTNHPIEVFLFLSPSMWNLSGLATT